MRTLCALIAVAAVAGPAAADGPLVPAPGWRGNGPAPVHHPDPGPGAGWRYYGLPNGPYVNPGSYEFAGTGPRWWGGWPWWGIPSYAGSFWTNGRSLYGPPIPTFGPTPGVFGASDDDKRFFTNPPPANGVFFGLGWGGYRSPSPRHLPLTVSVRPSVAVVPGPAAVTAGGAACLRVLVSLPDPAARLYVGTTELTTTGGERSFESPPLAGDGPVTYELVARWTDAGKPVAESRTVVARPGQTVRVDFRIPADR
jgi:uncharacterized protein (TIGR03000 family)